MSTRQCQVVRYAAIHNVVMITFIEIKKAAFLKQMITVGGAKRLDGGIFNTVFSFLNFEEEYQKITESKDSVALS